MAEKQSFTVPMASLLNESGKKDITIGLIGQSKWILSLKYDYIRSGFKFNNLGYHYNISCVCIYRFVEDEYFKEDFEVRVCRNFELLKRRTLYFDRNLFTYTDPEICWLRKDELKGSITLLEDSEDTDAEEVTDVVEHKTNSDSEETHCCSAFRLMDDFLSLLDNQDSFSDVTLKCGSETILVHKCIMSARSPVFAAMFRQTEMREGRDGIVDIDDIRPDIVRAMLKYLYTGKSDHVTPDSMAGDMLFAADKYQLQELKSICVEKLLSNMVASNALRNLVLGDLHDGSLKASAIEFICKNAKFSELEKSEDWRSLQKEKPELAMEVVTSMVKYLQK